jgi:hypothetical protein
MWSAEQIPEYSMETFPISGKRKVKSAANSEKSDCPQFWDSQGSVLEHYQDRGTTVNCAHSCEMCDKFKPAVSRKFQGLPLKGAFFFHDISHPHSVIWRVEPSDCCTSKWWNFLRTHLTNCCGLSLLWFTHSCFERNEFASEQEVKEMGHAWLTAWPKTCFLRAYRNLFTTWLSLLKSRGTVWKNYALIHFVLFIH